MEHGGFCTVEKDFLKSYNFLHCDWFRKPLFSTNSHAKLLTDSLLSDCLSLDSSISQLRSNL